MKNTLEIILITYNRKSFLQKTFRQLLAESSPVKDLDITVLDNCSTDGTSEYLKELSAKHPNIKHIRHNRNIGGNANIARAFESVTKPYFWILADDDTYDFSAWPQVENAIKDNADLIVVNTEILKGKMSYGKLIRILTFLPASILKSSFITPETLINIHYNISTWFPHMAAICEVFNRNGKIKTLDKNIVISGKENNKGIEYHRRTEGINYRSRMQFFEVGYLKTLIMLKDKKLRAQAAEYFAISGSFFIKISNTFKKNLTEYENNIANYLEVMPSLNLWQKMRFLTAITFNHIIFLLKYPYYRKKKKIFENRLKEYKKS